MAEPGLGATLADLARLMPHLSTVLLIGSVENIHRDAMSQVPGLPGRGYRFLFKQNLNDQTDLTQSIRAMTEGRVVVDVQIMESLLPTRPGKRPSGSGISAREVDVLGLIADGYRNNAIAERLLITTKTVERHIQSIYAKLGD